MDGTILFLQGNVQLYTTSAFTAEVQFLVFSLAVGQLEGLFLKLENIPIPQMFTHFPKSLKLWITWKKMPGIFKKLHL